MSLDNENVFLYLSMENHAYEMDFRYGVTSSMFLRDKQGNQTL